MSDRAEGIILWSGFDFYDGAEEAYIEQYAGQAVEPDESFGVVHDEHGHWHVILAPDRVRAEEAQYRNVSEAQTAAEKMFRLDAEGTP
ncbi:MAG TPA: hypothetical protein QGH10_13695 [Armatimonadota bacterium]|nr:hypothetical protein [Armatimonadota bacterium]